MKPRRSDPRLAWLIGGAGATLLGGAGAALGGTPGAAVGAALGAGAGLLRLASMKRRNQVLKRRLESAFSPASRRWLLGHYHHYRRLPAAWRERFDADVACFLAEKRISGVSYVLTDDDLLGVAASAVTLSLGWPDYGWDQLTEVLVYADDFDRDFGFAEPEFAGQAHPWGTVLISAPALEDSFADPEDGFHVGLHEFAHLLDLQGQHFGGIPAGMIGTRAADWQGIAEEEMARLRAGDSMLDSYGEEDPVEFLAVAVEAFFERPAAMRRRHPRLYERLCGYFLQDPAAWDQAIGIEEYIEESRLASERAPRTRRERPHRRGAGR